MSTNKEIAASLRKLATLISQNSNVKIPYDFDYWTSLSIFSNTKEEFQEAVKVYGADKDESEYLDYQKAINVRCRVGVINIDVLAPHGSCPLVEIGTKEVEEDEIIMPAITRKITKTVPVYQADCSEMMLP